MLDECSSTWKFFLVKYVHISIFMNKIVHNLFLLLTCLHKLHCRVYYEEVYYYKMFQKFSIKILTKIAYINFKNKQKVGISSSKIKHSTVQICSNPQNVMFFIFPSNFGFLWQLVSFLFLY